MPDIILSSSDRQPTWKSNERNSTVSSTVEMISLTCSKAEESQEVQFAVMIRFIFLFQWGGQNTKSPFYLYENSHANCLNSSFG